jgi:hypothetical protein
MIRSRRLLLAVLLVVGVAVALGCAGGSQRARVTKGNEADPPAANEADPPAEGDADQGRAGGDADRGRPPCPDAGGDGNPPRRNERREKLVNLLASLKEELPGPEKEAEEARKEASAARAEANGAKRKADQMTLAAQQAAVKYNRMPATADAPTRSRVYKEVLQAASQAESSRQEADSLDKSARRVEAKADRAAVALGKVRDAIRKVEQELEDTPANPGPTRDNYHKVRIGMTPAQVQTILGPGKEVARSEGTLVMTWQSEAGLFDTPTIISITFDHTGVTAKAILGQ